jgi:xanthosine utilization system XapX-like protein
MKMVLMALLSGVFVSIGVWLLPRQPIIAVASIVFFGLCGLVVLVQLLPNSSYLTLTERGFEFASLFRKHFIPWSQVGSFFPIRIQSHRMVGWNYLPGVDELQRLRRINTAVAGAEAALPDTYGMSAEQLANLMNQLRAKHATAGSLPTSVT